MYLQVATKRNRIKPFLNGHSYFIEVGNATGRSASSSDNDAAWRLRMAFFFLLFARAFERPSGLRKGTFPLFFLLLRLSSVGCEWASEWVSHVRLHLALRTLLWEQHLTFAHPIPALFPALPLKRIKEKLGSIRSFLFFSGQIDVVCVRFSGVRLARIGKRPHAGRLIARRGRKR